MHLLHYMFDQCWNTVSLCGHYILINTIEAVQYLKQSKADLLNVFLLVSSVNFCYERLRYSGLESLEFRRQNLARSCYVF